MLPPPIALDAFPIVSKRSVLVLVSASSESSVEVFGQTGWRLKPKRHRAKASKIAPKAKPEAAGLIVGLSGGTQTVRPGEIGPFNVRLPKSVMRRLSRLTPKESLKGTITARTTDLAGRLSERTIAVRLPDQERGRP